MHSVLHCFVPEPEPVLPFVKSFHIFPKKPGFNFISEILCRRVSVVALFGFRFLSMRLAKAPEERLRSLSAVFGREDSGVALSAICEVDISIVLVELIYWTISHSFMGDEA